MIPGVRADRIGSRPVGSQDLAQTTRGNTNEGQRGFWLAVAASCVPSRRRAKVFATKSKISQ